MQHSVVRSIQATIRERPLLAFSAGFALLLGILFFDPLLMPRTFVSRDLIPFFLPIEKAVHAAWRSGHVPLLIPEISFGRLLAANPNTGVFYPVRLAMALLPFSIAFKLFPVIHLWLAGVGSFLLARFIGTSRAGAAAAGVAFGLSGVTLSEVMYPNILPGLALMPFVIFAAGRLVRRPSGRTAAGFALVWGMGLLVGDVFTAGLAFFGAALLTLERAEEGTAARSLGRLMAVSVPGILLAGIQIVPAMLFVPHTVRALGRFPVRVALMWSVSAWRFLELLIPFPFGSPVRHGASWGNAFWSGKSIGFFNTLYPGVLASLALLGTRLHPGRRLFLYGLLFASLVLAVSGFYCPEPWLRMASPIPLRYPEKFMGGFSLSAALLLGTMIDGILARSMSKRLSRIAFAAGGAAGGAAAFVMLFPETARAFILARWSPSPGSAAAAVRILPRSLAIGAIWWVSAAVLVAWAVRQRRRRLAAAAILGFIALNLGMIRFQFVTTGLERDAFSAPPAVAVIRAVNEGPRYGFLPIEDYFLAATDSADLVSDVAATFGIPYAFNQDYDASDLYRVDVARQQIYRDEGHWKGLPGYLAAFSARSAILDAGRMPFGFLVPGPRIGEKWIVINPAALPRVRFATEVREVEGPLDAYSAVHDETQDLTSVTVIETGRKAAYRFSGGRIQRVVADGNRLDVETETAGPARLILPRAWFPYRQFLLDRSPIEAAPTNLCLSSVAIPSGHHRLTVEEQLPGGAAGILISTTGVLLVVLLWRRGKQHAEPA